MGLVAVLGLAAFMWYLWIGIRVFPRTLALNWFDTDTERVSGHLAVRGGMVNRTAFHPLLQLIGQPPTRVWLLFGADRFLAVHLTIAAFGALFVGGVYVLGRRVGLTPWHASAPAAWCAVTGAATVFFSIPETFGPAAALTTVGLLLVAPRNAQPSIAAAATALIVSSAAVVTGAIAPLAIVMRSGMGRRWKAQVLATAMICGSVLFMIQAVVFETRLGTDPKEISRWLHRDLLGRFVAVIRIGTLDAWILPPSEIGSHGMMTTDDPAWTRGPLVFIATLGTLILLIVTIRGVSKFRSNELVMPCVLAIGFQLLALVFYGGDEPFLYSAMLLAPLAALMVTAGSAFPRTVTGICWATVPVLATANLATAHAITNLALQ